MDEENNWDLQALVRSCCFVSNGSSSSSAVRSPKVTFTSSSSSSSFDLCSRPSDEEEENKKKKKKKKNSKIDIDQLFSKELEDLYKPFLIQSPSTSSSSQATRATPKQVTGLFSDDASRFKKRINKKQKRIVTQVPADGLSTDFWSWRKYGQKPIKGSPYPRGYYRCSSSKECEARKQVERCPSDPSLLLVTYAAEHNHPIPPHRNSLSGSTRINKLTTASSFHIHRPL